MCFDSFHSMYVSEVLMPKSGCVIVNFAFIIKQGCVCLVLRAGSVLSQNPQIFMAKLEQQPEPWHSREVQNPIWHSVFSQRRITELLWGFFPRGIRAGIEPQVGQGWHLQALGTRISLEGTREGSWASPWSCWGASHPK